MNLDARIVTLVLLGLPRLAGADELGFEPGAEGPAAAETSVVETPAHEPDAPSAEAAGERAPVALLTLRTGGHFPQLFNELGGAVSITLGGGWVLPVPALEHRLAVVADATYAQPGRTEELRDPRVPGGAWSYELVQHDLGLFLGGQYHFADLRALWVPYAALGLRAHLAASEIDGEAAGAAFGNNEETSTQLGGAARGGMGMRLGPGFAQAELELGFAGLDHLITGDANQSSLGLRLGYSLVL